MALTVNLRATGRAAQTELRDIADFFSDEAREQRRIFNVQWVAAMEQLQNIDPDWEKWFDAQPEQTCRDMLPLVLERIEACKLAATVTLNWDAAAAVLHESELGTHFTISGGEALEIAPDAHLDDSDAFEF